MSKKNDTQKVLDFLMNLRLEQIRLCRRMPFVILKEEERLKEVGTGLYEIVKKPKEDGKEN